MGKHPVATLTGPRQAGKTTLARSCFPGFTYATLEDPEIRILAQDDPRAFLRKFPEPLIIGGVKRFCANEPSATSPMLVYDGESYPERDGVRCLNFRELR